EGRDATAARSPFSVQRERTTSIEGDDQDDDGDRGDGDPRPLLLGQTGRLELIEVLRQLVQILRRELRDLVVDLLLRQAVRRQAGSHLFVGHHVAHQSQIGFALGEALVDRRLRRHHAGERRHRRHGNQENEYERHRTKQTLHEYLLYYCGRPWPPRFRVPT